MVVAASTNGGSDGGDPREGVLPYRNDKGCLYLLEVNNPLTANVVPNNTVFKRVIFGSHDGK